MAFCENCGHQISNGAKFCANCGAPAPKYSAEGTRETKVFAGQIHKCPNCGEIIDSFVSVCPSCGYELRDTKAAASVQQFFISLTDAQSAEQKAQIIRNFPIPNAKEDIIEFLLLTISNVSGENEKTAILAWNAKLEQVYQKAIMTLPQDASFEKIQELYTRAGKEISKAKARLNLRAFGKGAKKAGSAIARGKGTEGIFSKIGLALPNIIIVCGWLASLFIVMPLCGKDVDVAGFNAYQLLYIVDLIAGAIFIPFTVRCQSAFPKVIVAVGLAMSIASIIPKCSENLDVAGFNAYQLLMIVEIICAIVIIVRMFKKEQE